MRIRNVDKNWDWCFGKGYSDYVKEKNAIEIDIQMKLKEWFQDCFFALQNGIPWSIRLGWHNQKELLDQDILGRIREVEGVIDVVDFQSEVFDRRYRCTCSVLHQYSTEAAFFIFDSKDIVQ